MKRLILLSAVTVFTITTLATPLIVTQAMSTFLASMK